MDTTYRLLDHRVALGGADDVVLRAPAPEAPTVDGRVVTDPRLIAALSVPQDVTRAETLDRVAKLGGVLRVLGSDGATAIIVHGRVPEPARTFALLAGLRVGVEVVLQDEHGTVELGTYGTETLTILPAADAAEHSDASAGAGAPAASKGSNGPEAGALTLTVRSVRSHFEGVAVLGGDIVRDLDQMMRDARIEPVASGVRPPARTALTVPGRSLDQSEAAEFAAALLLT